MQRRYCVLIDWVDGEVEDTDEIAVFADSAAEAITKARKRWRLTIGVRYPTCRIVESTVLTPKLRASFA